MLQPRDYQEACIRAHFNYFMLRQGNPLFVVPTGGGKSLIIAEFVRRTLERWPDQRFIVLTHVKELIEQNHSEFMNQWGILAPVGIYSAGLGRRDTRESVIFAGIQSVWTELGKPSPAAHALGKFDLLLIDEAHLLPKSGDGRYRSYIAWLREQNPAMKVLGYTATPYRLEGGLLHRGEGRIFTDIAYEVPLRKLVGDGYLVPLVAKRPHDVINTAGVGTSAGDFKPGELERSAMKGDIVRLAVTEMVDIAKRDGRKHWLVFACGVEHGAALLEAVRSHGVSAEIVLGETPKEERDRIIRDAKAGALTCLVNVGVLTTGFNWPRCDLLAVLRPTQSKVLYVQMMGRGMRTFPGKDDCLVLDYGENVLRHGPINDIKVLEEEKGEGGGGDAPAKVCPQCSTIVGAATAVCSGCGFEFPKSEIETRHSASASTLSPIDFSVKVKPRVTFDVTGVYYERHQKEGKPDSLRVSYFCGPMRKFNEWICLEHVGFARRSAHDWWSKRGRLPVPQSISEALERVDELECPLKIVVQEDGKYERVVDHSFRRQPQRAPSGSAGDVEEAAPPVAPWHAGKLPGVRREGEGALPGRGFPSA